MFIVHYLFFYVNCAVEIFILKTNRCKWVGLWFFITLPQPNYCLCKSKNLITINPFFWSLKKNFKFCFTLTVEREKRKHYFKVLTTTSKRHWQIHPPFRDTLALNDLSKLTFWPRHWQIHPPFRDTLALNDLSKLTFWPRHWPKLIRTNTSETCE